MLTAALLLGFIFLFTSALAQKRSILYMSVCIDCVVSADEGFLVCVLCVRDRLQL